MLNRKEIFEEWISLYNKGEIAKLKEQVKEYNAADMAEFFSEIDKEMLIVIFRLLSKDQAAETFSYMDSDLQEHVIQLITDKEIESIVREMSLDDTVDFLGEMPANLITKILRNTDRKTRDLINAFLNYPEDSAGSIMTIEFMHLSANLTVGEAMDLIRKTGLDKETIYSCYVVDRGKLLIGVIQLKDIILSADYVKIADIMEDDPISIKTIDDREVAAELIKKYDLIALPVVDNENRLVGIITVDDIVDVIEEEDTEDIEKMSALIPAENEYLKTGAWSLAKNRIFWLLALMISGTVSAYIIKDYEAVLATQIALSGFFTILMDTGGNAGSQTSTLIIRGMAVGEIELKDTLKVLWKEMRVGILTGISLALVNFLRLWLFKTEMNINITVSLSLICTVIMSKSLGAILPLLAKKVNVDPAIMAGPLITTVVDAVSLIIYFNIAMALVL